MPKGNPNPKTQHLEATRFQSIRTQNLGKQVSTRYPVEVQKALETLDNKQAFIRSAVEVALRDPDIRAQVEALAEQEG